MDYMLRRSFLASYAKILLFSMRMSYSRPCTRIMTFPIHSQDTIPICSFENGSSSCRMERYFRTTGLSSSALYRRNQLTSHSLVVCGECRRETTPYTGRDYEGSKSGHGRI